MSSAPQNPVPDLGSIAEKPLEERAASYAVLLDALRRELETDGRG